MKRYQKYIGIDVSKKKLDFFIPDESSNRPIESGVITNDDAGFRKLASLAKGKDALLCCEPTGGYEVPLVNYMHRHGIPIAYTSGVRVREFAKAKGQFSKNDPIDAKMISEFASVMSVQAMEPKDFARVEISRRYKLYRTYTNMAVMLKGRIDTEPDRAIAKELAREIARFEKRAATIIEKCLQLIAQNEELQHLSERMRSIKGVADKTIIAILADLPELGHLPDNKLYKLVGLAPQEWRSGDTICKKSRIRGGRISVRNALYMSAMPAVMWNSIINDYYTRKRAEGHPPKWCIVPVMRKLLSLLNHIARDPNYFPLETERMMFGKRA